MVLISPSSIHPAPLSLPLFKLSFCTTPTVRANLVWTHLPQRDNVFAVFDCVSQKDAEGFMTQQKILKLVRGGDLLEQIELETLALQARLDEERNRSQLLEDADRYVILLVKRPLLAMRYQLPNGQIRRIQLNFRPESGYDAALNALYNLGLPTREKAQPTAQPIRAASSFSQPYQHIIPQPQPVRLLPSPDFTYRPSTSSGFEHRPSSSAPEIPSERPWTAPDPVSFSQTLPPKRELPVAMQAHRSGPAPKKLCPSPSSLDQNTLSRREAPSNSRTQVTNMPLFDHGLSVTAPPPSSSAGQSVSEQMLPPAPPKNIRRQAEVFTTQAASHLSTEIHEALTPGSNSRRSAALMKPPAKRKPRANPKAAKKMSSTQSKELQEVGFDIQGAVEGESRNETSHSVSILRQGLQGTRLQAKAVIPETLTKTPSKTLSTSDVVQVASPHRSGATAMDSAKQSFYLPGTAVRPSPKPSKSKGFVVLRPGRQAMTELLARNSIGNHQATDDPSSMSADPASKYPLLVGASEVSPEEFMAQLSGFIHDFRHLPAPTTSTASSTDLAAYAAQPDDVRQALIKDMVYEFLGDENFIKLAEDVSQEWTRIGLGF